MNTASGEKGSKKQTGSDLFFVLFLNQQHCGVEILTCFMEAHWIFCEPRDDFNAELNGKKKV